MFRFPWTDLHSLNLDWFLTEWAAFKNKFTTATATAESISASEEAAATVELNDEGFNFTFQIPRGASISGSATQYATSDSGTTAPTSGWQTDVPTVQQGAFLWTRVTVYYDNDTSTIFYVVTRMGLDGTGSVNTVNGYSPDSNGNVTVPLPAGSSVVPAMDGTGAAGSSTFFARGDHVHPKDTSKMDLVPAATEGHVAMFNSSGQVVDGGSISASQGLYGKTILCIGDSFANGVESNSEYGWPYYMAQATGATVIIVGNSGAGYEKQGNGSTYGAKNFSEMFSQWVTNNPTTTVDMVVACGGYNDVMDSNITETTLASAVKTFIDNVRATFPSAPLYVIPNYTTTLPATENAPTFLEKMLAIFNTAKNNAVPTTDYFIYCFLGYNTKYGAGDDFHLNDAGYKFMGVNVGAFLQGSKLQTEQVIPYTAFTAVQDGTSISSAYRNFRRDGNKLYIHVAVANVTSDMLTTAHTVLIQLPEYFQTVNNYYVPAFIYSKTSGVDGYIGQFEIRSAAGGGTINTATQLISGEMESCNVFIDAVVDIV